MLTFAAGAWGATGISRKATRAGTTTLKAGAIGLGGGLAPEFLATDGGNGGEGGGPRPGHGSPRVSGVGVTSPGSELQLSFNGLDHYDQRTANGGNQWSLEPPDQGLCVGAGHVLETVNTVLRVYDTSGNPQTGVVDHNTFYGYPAEVDRSTGVIGPFITDPSCYYDAATQRWFHVVLTLEVDPTSGAFLGPNHIDLAVSASSDPAGSWTIYRVPVQDDGTDGTPDHNCSLNPDGTGHGPCIGDYPHLGVDANGVYVTTNEYSLLGPPTEFHGAQIYAFDKAALVAGAASVNLVQFDTGQQKQPGFTVWPATSPTGGDDAGRGGTEYFMSGLVSAQPDGETPTDKANKIAVWALTNTSSLRSSSPSPALTTTMAKVPTYTSPPRSDQKPGPTPLRDCINDTVLGCWQLLLDTEPPHDQAFTQIDSNDGRMQQVTLAGGRLYGSLDTGVRLFGEHGNTIRAGASWFVIKPSWHNGNLSAQSVNGGILAVRGNNVTYPAVGVSASGRVFMGVTLVGNDYYPSAAYAELRSNGHTSAVRVAGAGLGPDDGFSGYDAFGPPTDPRWGDYGATAIAGDTLWLANEFIGQTCTFDDWLNDPTCGGTRTALANWGTHISAVKP
jgi:hypothetical protein